MDPALSLNPGAGATDKAGKQLPRDPDGPAADLQMIWNRAGSAGGLTMSKMLGRKGLGALLSMLAMGAALSFGIGKAVAADDVTEGQIVRALAPAAKAPLTRGLSTAPQADPAATAAEGRLLHAIRGRATRSLSVSEREEIATIAKDKPNIDLEITFDYNSANISTKSLPSVQALGKALTNPDLKGSTFIVAGHTDAHRQILDRPCRPRDRRLWQEQAEGSGQPAGRSEPPRAGRQHGQQDHGGEVRPPPRVPHRSGTHVLEMQPLEPPTIAKLVMPGLVPGIHVPAMTKKPIECAASV